MRKMMVIFCLLAASQWSYGQSDTSIIGKWQIVGMYNGEVYINNKTDSSSVTDEMRQLYPETAKQQQLIAMTNKMFGVMHYRFGADGNLVHMFNDTMPFSKATYRIKKAGLIEVDDKGGDGRSITDTITYKFGQGLLYLKHYWEERPWDVILEKVK